MKLTYDMLTTSEREVVNAIVREMCFIVMFARKGKWELAHNSNGVKEGLIKALISLCGKKFDRIKIIPVLQDTFIEKYGEDVLREYTCCLSTLNR